MAQTIGQIALLVREYDEAVEFFTQRLGFEVREDTVLDAKKRWVLVGPAGDDGTAILLARAATARQRRQIGRQGGGRVFLFLHTDDFNRDYHAMKRNGIPFTEEPREEAYGKVAVFLDLYGNRWDLLQPSASRRRG
jgi:lactoylglutathione lyase